MFLKNELAPRMKKVGMAKARSWYVESKVFEMLIKGGYSGLRMVETSKKKQGSLFVQRDEIAWLVGAVEGVLDVDTSEVFWDPSSAAYPRILVQRRENRHCRFIFIEEFEGRNRRGSVLILEGKYGQGWTRLVSELRIARSSLWKERDFRENKGTQVVAGRSFAEVVGGSKPLENKSKVVLVETMAGPSSSKMFRGRVQLHQQTKPVFTPTKVYPQVGLSKAIEEAGGCFGVAPVKTQAQAKEKGAVGSVNSVPSVLPKTVQNPVIPGVEAPNGGFESEGDGQGQASVHEGVDLQGIMKCLMDIRGQLELGLKTVEVAFHMLESKESMGCEGKEGVLGLGERGLRVTQAMGCVEAGWSKPKRKRFRRINKSQSGLLGPKPSKDPRCPGLTKSSPGFKPSKTPAQASHCPGSTSSFTYRILSHLTQQSGQVGESSEMGAARAIGVIGSTFADASSGEHLAGVGTLKPAIPGTTRGIEMDGEFIGEAGLGDQPLTQRLVAIPEDADDMGYDPSTSTLRLSTIPVSDKVLGCLVLPVKSSKRQSVYS
jgi:hypothetical protein